MIRRIFLLAGLTVLVSGCAAIGHSKQLSLLDPSLSAYTGAIRWGNIDSAAGFARPRGQAARKVDPHALSGLKITGYKVRINKVNDNADEASVSISFTYYHENQASIRQVNQTATWYYSDADKSWLLDGNLPDFKR